MKVKPTNSKNKRSQKPQQLPKPKQNLVNRTLQAAKAQPGDILGGLLETPSAKSLRQETVLQLQRLHGNAYVQSMLAQRGEANGAIRLPNRPYTQTIPLPATGQVQLKDTAQNETEAAPDPALIEAIITYLQKDSRAKDLVLSKKDSKQLRRKLIKPRSIRGDKALKTQLANLNKDQRQAVADAALAQLKARLAQESGSVVNELVDEIGGKIETKLVALADYAIKAEEAEQEKLAQLSARERRKYKKRPPFPLILKYLCRRVLFKQIDKPRATPYSLGSDYARPLGAAGKDPIFPEVHEAEMIAKLKQVSTPVRGLLKAAIASKSLNIVAGYALNTAAIVPRAIEDEYALLSDRVRDNIEGGLEGYFACRMGLLNAFGNPVIFEETLRTANDYYASLQEANFLQGYAGKKVGGRTTLVHPEVKTALEKAEAMIKEKGWQEPVLNTTKKYWSTNLRENRNSPTYLSQHSYGMALDINPNDNPNLASFGAANWKFVAEMLGEDLFNKNAAAIKKIKDKTSDPDAILVAAEKIRAKSEQFTDFFENEANLKARLVEIVGEKGIQLSSEGIDKLLELAKQAASAAKKPKANLLKQITEAIFADLWPRNPSSTVKEDDKPPLVDKLLKLLGHKVKKMSQYKAKKDLIAAQIQTPTTKASKAAKRQGLQSLFGRKLVGELTAIPETDRATLATQVLSLLKLPLDRQQTNQEAKYVAQLLETGFKTLKQSRKKTGEKVGSGKGLPNVAAQGFSNLSPKLVTALVSSEGGNLKWLGVHNQDMHHFELKTKPALPKASAPGAESDKTGDPQ